MTETTAIVVSKTVATGGLGVLIADALGNTEFMALFIIGLISSSMSFFYDWAHREEQRFTIKELTELFRYTSYGVVVIFVVFYLGRNHIGEYINFPDTAWGFIASISAGNAVIIVNWTASVIHQITTKRIER